MPCPFESTRSLPRLLPLYRALHFIPSSAAKFALATAHDLPILCTHSALTHQIFMPTLIQSELKACPVSSMDGRCSWGRDTAEAIAEVTPAASRCALPAM